MSALVGMLFGSGLWLVIQSFTNPKPSKIVRSKRNEWPVFIDEIASGIQVGMSLQEAFFSARNTLPLERKVAFDRAYFQVQHGASFNDTLQALASDIHSHDFSRLVNLLLISNKQGIGQLSSLLFDFSAAIRRDQDLILEIHSKYQTNKIAARVASVAPLFVLIFTASRKEVREIYLTSEGIGVLVIIAVVSIGGYLAMVKIATFPGVKF
jgi:Flp pilus assembly protein TadB